MTWRNLITMTFVFIVILVVLLVVFLNRVHLL